MQSASPMIQLNLPAGICLKRSETTLCAVVADIGETQSQPTIHFVPRTESDLEKNEEVHRLALRSLRAQEDRAAIAEAIAQMEAGQGRPAEEAFEDLRKEFGFPAET